MATGFMNNQPVPRDETPVSSRTIGRNSVSRGAGCLRVGFGSQASSLTWPAGFQPVEAGLASHLLVSDWAGWKPARRVRLEARLPERALRAAVAPLLLFAALCARSLAA